MIEEKEFIDFNEIKKIISVENEELFLIYLKEIYNDLADRNETNRKKGIMKIIFLDYLNHLCLYLKNYSQFLMKIKMAF